MKASVSRTETELRETLLQRMRLKRPRTHHEAKIALTVSGEELELVRSISRKTLETWAGPRLGGVARELVREAQADTSLEISVTSPLGGPDELRVVELRAKILVDLVNFTIAEQRMAAEARRGLCTPVHDDDLAVPAEDAPR